MLIGPVFSIIFGKPSFSMRRRRIAHPGLLIYLHMPHCHLMHYDGAKVQR